MNTQRISYERWVDLFNKREFNSPGERNDTTETRFASEFEAVCEVVDDFCKLAFAPEHGQSKETYRMWPYYNWSRVIDIEMETDRFLDRKNVCELQSVLAGLPQKWMVIMTMGNTLFVTQDEVVAFLPVPDCVEGVNIDWLIEEEC